MVFGNSDPLTGRASDLSVSDVMQSGLSSVQAICQVGDRIAIAGYNEWKFLDDNRINRIVSGVPLS